MEWITTKQIQSTDGKTEHIHCKLILEFSISNWNKKEKSPVIEIEYFDYKVESGWWIDNAKTKWYVYKPHKNCRIKINYFQRHPEIMLNSSEKKVNYQNFTVNYCKSEAIKMFKSKLVDIIDQL